MGYGSGLSYDQLKGIVIADAFSGIERSKGSIRANRKGYCQVLLSYQAPAPGTATGKRQVRISTTLDVKYTDKLSDRRKRELIGAWKSKVLEDARQVKGTTTDTSNTVRSLCKAYIAKQERDGAITKTSHQGRDTEGISHTTAFKRREDLKRIEGCKNGIILDMPLENVTHEQIQDLISDLKERYSGESVRATFAALRMVFKDALGKGNESPCDDIKLPNVTYRPETSTVYGRGERSKNILSEEQCAELIRECGDSIGHKGEAIMIGALLALTAGLRAGECAGLMWRDVHLDSNNKHNAPYVSIERTSIRYKDASGKWVYAIGLPKSKASKRDVPLYPETVAILRRLKAAHLEALMMTTPEDGERKAIGDIYVLGDLKGNYRHTNTLVSSFMQHARRKGLRGACGDLVTLHNLRDSYASRLANRGVADTRIQGLLGHASIAITQARYISHTDEDKFDAIRETKDIWTRAHAVGE